MRRPTDVFTSANPDNVNDPKLSHRSLATILEINVSHTIQLVTYIVVDNDVSIITRLKKTF
jgi:hypothetical protein